MTWPGFFLLFLLASCPTGNPRKDAKQNNNSISITYTGNMGVLISNEKAAVWIDGLHEYYGPEYLNPPDSILEKAFSKTTPFNHLQWLLFTHYHRDHFSKKLVNRFLQLAQNHKVVGAAQVVDSFSAKNVINAWDKNGEVLHDDSSSLRIKAFNIPHTWPQRHGKVQNIAYLAELNGVRILHVGDADTNPKAFEFLHPGSADIMIVPAWFINDEKGEKIIERLKAKKIVVTHIAPGEKPGKSFTVKNTEIIFFEIIGQFTSL
jgi:L-ascorbate metabolism protein UlaG (beta-lactamase superfamily)